MASNLIVQTIAEGDLSQVDAFDILAGSLFKSPMTKALLTSMIDIKPNQSPTLTFVDSNNHYRIAIEFGTTYILAKGNEYVAFELQQSLASIDGYMLQVVRGTITSSVETGVQVGVMSEYDRLRMNPVID